jgi:hypothetical protein
MQEHTDWERKYSMTSNLPMILIDEPGPYEPLQIWEQFLAEVEAMPDFRLKDRVVQNAKWLIAQKKQELRAKRHGVQWLH